MTRKLGDKLREYREKNGLTLGDVAKRLGCSYQAVQKWESGSARPRTDKLRRLAWLYGVQVEELLPVHDPYAHYKTQLVPELEARLSRDLSGLVQSSKERANRIYELAMRDMGCPGVLHSFLDEATESYLQGKSSDIALYEYAKMQIERMSKLMIAYEKKKEKERDAS